MNLLLIKYNNTNISNLNLKEHIKGGYFGSKIKEIFNEALFNNFFYRPI